MSTKAILVDLEYPRVEGNSDRVTVELIDVRVADDITLAFDFERDGWVVLMDKTKDAGGHMEVLEEQVEVGFFPAWHTDPEPSDFERRQAEVLDTISQTKRKMES